MTESLGKILIIDDTEVNRYVLARLLEKAGYVVIQAETGHAGLARIAECPDVAIIDVSLPDILGTEVARLIKSNPETASTMVLNISASHTRVRDRITALESGADGYLLQPIDPQELLATVANFIRIRRAEETTRRSNRELERFAFVASHDLQEPLRMVTGYLDLFKRRYGSSLDAPALEYIGYAFDGATRMSAMINDLLAMSQLELSALAKAPVNARHLVQFAMDNLVMMIQQSQASIECSELPMITVDGVLIAQVFQNLLINAINFRSVRKLEVHISAERQDDRMVFTVQDNGIGIAEQDIERVFSIFQRLRSDICPGSGIGLSLCKRIVERHGGSIGVRSKVDTGTCFWFSVPVREPVADAMPSS
jgi:signal transduction histidine kinase